MRLFSLILCVFAMVGSVLQAQDAGLAGQPVIEVEGVGVVTLAPDMAVLRFGVIARGETASEAMSQASGAMGRALAQVEAVGVAPEDVQTSDLTLNPIYDRNTQSDGLPDILGYRAANRLTVTVRNLHRLGDKLDALIADGVNEFQGIEFGLLNADVALSEARRLAVEDARAKAGLYAAAAGVSLGDLLMLTEGGSARPMPMQMEVTRSAVPIVQGQVSQTAQVRLRYAIVPD